MRVWAQKRQSKSITTIGREKPEIPCIRTKLQSLEIPKEKALGKKLEVDTHGPRPFWDDI